MTRRGARVSGSSNLAAVNLVVSRLAATFKCPVAARCECRCLAVAILAVARVTLAAEIVVAAATKEVAAAVAIKVVAVETVEVEVEAAGEVLAAAHSARSPKIDC